jgi:hypothetical protein
MDMGIEPRLFSAKLNKVSETDRKRISKTGFLLQRARALISCGSVKTV